MTEHLTPGEIADYVDDPEHCARREEIERHVAGCETCRQISKSAAEFDTALQQAILDEFVASVEQRRAMPDELRSAAERLDAEEREANAYLSGIVTSPAAFKRAALASKPGLYTEGTVKVLCEASKRSREHNPKHALQLADMALRIAARLPEKQYDAATRAEAIADAQLERGNALRYLTQYDDALKALNESEAAYRRTSLPERSLALVDYVRSVIYMETERIVEAAELAAQTALVFERYGDDDRVIHARLVIGGCLYYRQEYRLARDLYRALLHDARKLGDPLTLALCLMNLAHCESDLEESFTALKHYAEAAGIFERLDARTELLRARWGVADAEILMGNLDHGIRRLRFIAGEMLATGMTNDHAKVMLDVAGNLFAAGQMAELPQICAELVRVFTEAAMPENARMALAYLEAAIAAGAANRPLIDSVAGYLDRERFDQPFVPPPAA
jgi:tetratricopeptide (TPR) repeat protein